MSDSKPPRGFIEVHSTAGPTVLINTAHITEVYSSEGGPAETIIYTAASEDGPNHVTESYDEVKALIVAALGYAA